MTYRDDLDAAQARIEALEKENARLHRFVKLLASGWPEPLIKAVLNSQGPSEERCGRSVGSLGHLQSG